MTDSELDAIEARANSATEGPWTIQHNREGDVVLDANGILTADCNDDDDAAFIAHSRTALVARIRELEADYAAQASAYSELHARMATEKELRLKDQWQDALDRARESL